MSYVRVNLKPLNNQRHIYLENELDEHDKKNVKVFKNFNSCLYINF